LEIYEKTWKPKSEVCYEQPVLFPIFMIIKWAEKEEANHKINKRIKEMFKEWLIDEVKMLLDMGYNEKHQSMQSIGYKEIIPYIRWNYDLSTAEEKLKRNTHKYAKKQRTFFRRYIMDMKTFWKENVTYELLK
jgi:tRNA dimethylallyltransferase